MSRRVLAGTGYVSAESMAAHAVPTSADSQAWEKLRQSLHDNGYLLIRNALSRRAVLKARRRCIEYLKRMRSVSTDFEALRCPRATEPPIRLLDKVDLHADANILQVLEDDNLFQIYQHIYCAGQGLEYEGTATLQYKWLRAVGTGLFTGIHTDRVYMGSEASSMITMWIPLGDYPVHQGTLMVLRGSNSQPEFQNLRQTYGSSRVGKDGVQSGWLTEDPNELLTLHPEIPPGKVQWDTADVNAGDVIILSLDALHCSTTNTTNELRISCDTRWHVASEKSSFATSRKTL